MIEEFADHVLWSNDVGNLESISGKIAITESLGSFAACAETMQSIHQHFEEQGSFVLEMGDDRIYSPENIGFLVFMEFDAESPALPGSVGISQILIDSCKTELEEIVSACNTYFILFALPTLQENAVSYSCADAGENDLIYRMIESCNPDAGANDPFAYVGYPVL